MPKQPLDLNLLADCVQLLTTILKDNPMEDTFSGYIGQFKEAYRANGYTKSKIYGYQNPGTPLKIELDGVTHSLQEVTHLRLANLSKNDPYREMGERQEKRRKIYEHGATGDEEKLYHVPEGVYKLTFSRFAAEEWLAEHKKEGLVSEGLVPDPSLSSEITLEDNGLVYQGRVLYPLSDGESFTRTTLQHLFEHKTIKKDGRIKEGVLLRAEDIRDVSQLQDMDGFTSDLRRAFRKKENEKLITLETRRLESNLRAHMIVCWV